MDLLKWTFGDPKAQWPETYPAPGFDKPPQRVEGDALRVSYVGHASVLIQTHGVNMLIDPVWSERASPVRFAGPKRVNAPGIAFDDLPPHRRRAGVAQPLRPSRHGDARASGARAPAPRASTPLGNDVDHARRRSGDRARGATTGARASSSAAASLVHLEPSLSLVGARLERPPHGAVVRLRARDAGGQDLPHRRHRLRRRRHVPPGAREARRLPPRRSCRSAPTSRAGSCATST